MQYQQSLVFITSTSSVNFSHRPPAVSVAVTDHRQGQFLSQTHQQGQFRSQTTTRVSFSHRPTTRVSFGHRHTSWVSFSHRPPAGSVSVTDPPVESISVKIKPYTISLAVSVDVKHHVYLLTYLLTIRKIMCLWDTFFSLRLRLRYIRLAQMWQSQF